MENKIEKELKRIIEILLVKRGEEITEDIVKEKLEKTLLTYKDEKYDFSKLEKLILKQGKKKRKIMRYSEFSCEEILCIYIKNLLEKKFKIKYPNRNEWVHTLFNILEATIQMNNFYIIKFDFKDYFNTISSEYVYNKYIANSNIEREDKKLIEKFVKETQYTYAGLNTSNILVEIISKEFDKLIHKNFLKKGLIYYKRYIDDGIIILNNYNSVDEIEELLEECLEAIFESKQSKNKVKFNKEKFKIVSKDLLPADFDFLGYLFTLTENKNNIKIKYGITKEKITKYTKKIEEIFKDYLKDNNKEIKLELLRQRLKLFSSRVVYLGQKYNNDIWKVKGFISNYCELEYKLNNLDSKTELFLKNKIIEISKKYKLKETEYFLDNSETNIYNLYNNLKNKKTAIFIEGIGYDKKTLHKLLCKIKPECKTLDKYSYFELVKEYLIITKVGY
ncbi:MAG: hypothetical protein MR673_02450 [Fusobacterium perfoetens]|uniref:reverse transcriptase domain-containing protein n=1 Tax=Fusobacterium perfoetens TaxID=852 RepID=UPI0023F4B96A|nr:reverse transcriptase domain-containing protein [Fusobacterium perfoetens]MCI6151973.1 hypothetical protein [Fusobacterium perfoetens]MDY3237886.1 hypothetical protein [Fusobacterium perfoetens]